MGRNLGVCRTLAFTFLAILFIAAIPHQVVAQEPTAAAARSFQDLGTRLEPGTEVSVIDRAGNEVTGDVIDISASSLTLSIDDNQQALAESDVLRVTRPPHGLSRLAGGLIGAGLGFAAMAAIGVGCTAANEQGDGCPPGALEAGFALFVGSTVAGALLAGKTDEELLFQSGGASALTLSVAPVLSRPCVGARDADGRPSAHAARKAVARRAHGHAHLGSGPRTGGPSYLLNRHRRAGLLLRSVQSVAARDQREHEWPVTPVLAEGDRPGPLYPGPTKQDRTRAQHAATQDTRLSNAGGYTR